MLISEYSHRDDVLLEAAKELRKYDIKIRKNEKQKNIEINKQRRGGNKKIFKTKLEQQSTENAVFSNGICSSVPRFVLQACQKIQKESKTEGIFRKTGNIKKQCEIKEFLESGGSINDKNFSVIDIANLLKTFFRELPEPLIPIGQIQDALIRCLIHCITYEEKVEKIMLTLMFLPPITVNTLAYFLQFLEVIIKNSSENFMTLDNLVKVLTPSIIPLATNVPEKRLQSHFKIMELLIENANLIGVVPDRMIKREDVTIMAPMTEERKKKKRRSGSLNRVLQNFQNIKKKIVGTLGSTESLDKSHENTIEDITMMTPNITKSTKKRRLDKLSAFSSHKKKDAVMKLSSLPEMDDNCSPYAPRKTESRSSLGEKSAVNSSPKTRRHSLAPNTLTRNKRIAPVDQTNELVQREEEYVRVPKSEYEAFKTRLNSIETKITHEFHNVKLNSLKAERQRGPEEVENKFHETLHEVGKIEDSERKTEQLAKRLSRELKIRPHSDNLVVRSPSARKIGSLRRRRENTTRLSRNQSWHLGPSTLNSPKKDDLSAENNKTLTSSLSFYPKPNLKRARLIDSLASQDTKHILPVIPQSTEKIIPEKPIRKTIVNSEVWTPATDFFNDPRNTPSHEEKQTDLTFKTPTRPTSKRFIVANEIDLNNTPMLPPKMTPVRKMCTPMSDKKTPSMNKSAYATPSMNENREARASIIQIRNQNAGMVAQKAKLFDDLSADLNKSADKSIKIPRVIINKQLENVKNMIGDKPNNVPSNSTNSPRRSSRSPGINRRMHLRMSQQSPALKTIKENVENRGTRLNLLKPEVLNEIASPKNCKVLSQNNTPRRNSKTPKSSSKKRRTPRNGSASKSRSRHHISFD